MLRKGMFLADRYEIIEQIGTGGMSNVYKAKCHKLNRYVAIKVLKQEFNEDHTFVSKFRAEAQSAAGLTHPNIVNVYDVGDEDGIYYIVMELIEGITLKKYIEKRGRIPYKEAASIAIQVANGMEAAHKHNIVHRDIKPQNIIISKEGKVKVTDFGIAKAASSSTITSSAMGSVHYISPEQARGGYSDARSDIYSFGITLFEMLTGTVPFDGDTTVAVAVQHIQDKIPAPSTLASDIPISIDQIVLKCTQKKVELRYQTASELIVDLKRSLVMPNEQFVKMAPPFGAINTENHDDDQTEIPATDEDGDDILNEDNDDDLDDSDALLDDDNDDDDDLVDDDKESHGLFGKKKNADDADDDVDIDDENNDKLDMIFKWIGAGIIAIFLIIIIFVVVKFVGAGNNNKKEEATTQQETTEQQDDKDKVKVPDLTNMTVDDATEALNKLGLGVKTTLQPNDNVDEGKVIKQGTKAGTSVAKNTTITLIVSSGPESVTVPKVIGMSEDDARSALEKQGFSVDVMYDYSDSVKQGVVMKQSPNANASSSNGATVTITVSQGKKKVKVPDLMGATESEARQKLDNLGLNISFASQSVTGGTVTWQSVDAGSPVEEGTTISVTLTVKEEKIKLESDYKGYEPDAAVKALKAAGFDVTSVVDQDTKNAVASPYTGYTVSGLSITPGSYSKGQQVTIYATKAAGTN